MGSYIGNSHEIKVTLRLLEASRKAGKVCILWGPPGVGKTALVRALAEKRNVPLYILIPSTMDPTDIAGLPAIKQVQVIRPDGTEELISVTDQTLVWWAEEVIQSGEGIIFFDEASTATPAVQASLLSVLQGRTIGRHVIPKTVWMIAAANEASDAADGWELAPPMANRFTHIQYKPNDEDFFQGMLVNWGDDDLDEEARQVRLRIVAFLRQNTGYTNKMPAAAEEAGKAWPSYRSWDNLADLLYALGAPSEGEEDAIYHDARKKAIRGTVGEPAAEQFFKWEQSLRITPIETILKDPRNEKRTWGGWESMDVSSLFITFENALNGLSVENAADSAELFVAAHDLSPRKDIAASFAYKIIDDFGEVDADAMMTVLGAYQQFIRRAAGETRTKR